MNILDKSIETMKLDDNLKSSLMENEITTIQELCSYSRLELTNKNFTNSQINKLLIELQLSGLDLKANHAKKNSSVDHYKRYNPF